MAPGRGGPAAGSAGAKIRSPASNMNRHRYAQRRFTFAPSQDRNSLQSPQSIRVQTVSRLDHRVPLPPHPHLLHNSNAFAWLQKNSTFAYELSSTSISHKRPGPVLHSPHRSNSKDVNLNPKHFDNDHQALLFMPEWYKKSGARPLADA